MNHWISTGEVVLCHVGNERVGGELEEDELSLWVRSESDYILSRGFYAGKIVELIVG